MRNDDAIREAARKALAENGVGEPGSDMHSWRCAYPDCYGPCDCLAETITDVIDAVRPLIEADLRERLAAAIESRASEVVPAGWRGTTHYADGLGEAARIVRERP